MKVFIIITVIMATIRRHRYYRHYHDCFCVTVVATSGEEGRKSIIKEIELGKELGDSSPENVVKFIGCVTTQSKRAIIHILLLHAFYSRSALIFLCLLFVWLFV